MTLLCLCCMLLFALLCVSVHNPSCCWGKTLCCWSGLSCSWDTVPCSRGEALCYFSGTSCNCMDHALSDKGTVVLYPVLMRVLCLLAGLWLPAGVASLVMIIYAMHVCTYNSQFPYDWGNTSLLYSRRTSSAHCDWSFGQCKPVAEFSAGMISTVWSSCCLQYAQEPQARSFQSWLCCHTMA